MSKTDEVIEAFQDHIKVLSSVIDQQVQNNNKALDLLEELSMNHDGLEEEVEQIMRILTHGA